MQILFVTFVIVGSLAILLIAGRVFLALFGLVPSYLTEGFTAGNLASGDYVRFLGVISDAAVHRNTIISVLKNGEEIYAAELAAIRDAQYSVNLESYEFLEGEVTRWFMEAMTQRARAGVRVKVVIDAMGSFSTHDNYFRELRAAGGIVKWYHPVRWYSWPKVNNRTHRKLLIVDGKVAFCGGADWADEWLKPTKNAPVWRDTMFRVEGDAVASLQSVFAENWLESSGTILTGEDQFPAMTTKGPATALVVNSTPHTGQTRARILFQILLDSAHETIEITTPYFLPDKAARRAMIRAVHRGVRVRIVTAGKRIDHPFVRHLSHSLEGALLKNAVEVYEYEASMIHAKIMVVDRSWVVLGSTNFDHRSFGLNDEVNIAALDDNLAARLLEDFEDDLQQTNRRTYELWQKRTVKTRAVAYLYGLLEREE